MCNTYRNHEEARNSYHEKTTLSQDEVFEQIFGVSGRNRGCERKCERRCSKNNDAENTRNCPKQRHTHEYVGSVKIAQPNTEPHNHRFAGVTGEAIPLPKGNHYHKLEGNTDFYEDHFHKVIDKTGPAIPVGDGKHVHFVEGETTVNDFHRHEFEFTTLIDNPIGD